MRFVAVEGSDKVVETARATKCVFVFVRNLQATGTWRKAVVDAGLSVHKRACSLNDFS